VSTVLIYIWLGFFAVIIVPLGFYAVAKMILDLQLPKGQTVMCFIFFPLIFVFGQNRNPKITKENNFRLNILGVLVFIWFIVGAILNKFDV
jgi:hypothetical protein